MTKIHRIASGSWSCYITCWLTMSWLAGTLDLIGDLNVLLIQV